MKDNVLKIPWIWTTEGRLSPEEIFEHAHEIRGLDLGRSGMEISSELRFLEAVFALILRAMPRNEEDEDDTQSLTKWIYKRKPLPLKAREEAFSQISDGVYLQGGKYPFMQFAKRGKEQASKPVAKLYPENPAEVAVNFWNLFCKRDDTLPSADAVLALNVFYNFAPTGNAAYQGRKMLNGSPAFRFPGAGYSATEMISYSLESLLQTLAMNLPKSWVTGSGLPAWADRRCERSADMGIPHPLWAGTWSSNAVLSEWNEQMDMTAIEIGGIPEEWFYISMGRTPDDWKAWWTSRNESDPLYLYIQNKEGKKIPQRLDIGRPETQLAIEWIEQGKSEEFCTRAGNRIFPCSGTSILFLRHLIEGSAHSPLIRASQTLIGRPEIWCPNESVRDAAEELAEFVRKLHITVTGPFRRKKPNEPSNYIVLDTLEKVRGDASTTFWRYVANDFEQSMHDIPIDGEVTGDMTERLAAAAVSAFVDTIAPYKAQLGLNGEYAESRITGRLRRLGRRDESASQVSNDYAADDDAREGDEAS